MGSFFFFKRIRYNKGINFLIIFCMAMQLTDANFEAEVIQSEIPVLVDFWAPWCGPCQILGPVVDELASEITHAKVGKVNVDENPGIASTYGVMSIPTIKFFKGGVVVKETIGVQSKEDLKAILESL
jgi:thioredoxin 1